MRSSPRLRRLLVILVCAAIALACAVVNVAHVSVLPPRVTPRQLDIAAATTRVAVDLPKPLVRNALATDLEFQNLQRRAVLIANLMTSDAAMERVAREAGIPRSAITANTRVVFNAETAMLEPDSERRAEQIADELRPYELEVRPDPTYPKITIYSQAPSVPEAQRLADAVMPAVRAYLAELSRRTGADPSAQVRLEQLGKAQGAIVNGGTAIEMAGLTFLFVFAATCVIAFFFVPRVRRRGHGRPGRASAEPEPPFAHDNGNGSNRRRGQASALAGVRMMRAPGALTPALALPSGSGFAVAPVTAVARAEARETPAAATDSWPRTPRLLPWLIAVFMVVVWLFPFNEIQLAVSLPIDLKFDRLFLPVIAGLWILMAAIGGPYAPKIRITPIHLAVGAVLAVAFLSLVLEAHSLTRTLEFDTAVKKLTLLGAYAVMFVMVASVIRRSEVQAFLTFTLVLASITAFGTIVEYRFNFNVFFWFSDRILPGVFSVADVASGSVDEIGRRATRGPAQVALEAVAMMAMAMPIALARLIHATPGQRRWVYAAVIALLMAGMVSTFRKTGLIAPVAVCLTFAYFRRRELLKLAPLGIVLLLVIQVLSPGALTGVAGQLDRSRLGVTTVSDRTADYDAVRPDVWAHLAFGRGYGSYEHTSYRILDMELLRQIIEVGVFGLLIYFSMALVVVAVARRPIRARGPDAPAALAVAATAVCFLVVSTLFDVMSFPHVPYIFLWMAGLLAVMTSSETKPGTRWSS